MNELTEVSQSLRRIKFLYLIFLLFLGLILGNIFYLQVIKGDYFYRISEENRIQLIPIPAPRGFIYDCQGIPLVKNRASFDIMFVQVGLDKKRKIEVINKLSRILNVTSKEIILRIKEKEKRPFEPALIMEDVDKKMVIKIAEQKIDLPGVLIQINPKRCYIYGNLASHLLGYLGEVDEEDINRSKKFIYKRGDLIGKSGVEKVLDLYLRGEDGGAQVEVNAKGRKLRVLSYKRPKPGRDIFLTINYHIQKIAEEAMKEHQGAVIIMNCDNGKILAMVSKPDFDPNLFTIRLSREIVKEILEHPKHILMNRAIQAQYSPGSIFKIIVVMAALENKRVNPRWKIICKGKYNLGNREFKCWKKEGHGEVDLLEAISKSCNVYFYRLGRRVGINLMVEIAEKFGLGRHSNIILPEEKRGLLPTPLWKKRNFKKPWYLGETINMSIGQGYLLVTPLQMACLISGIKNRRFIFKPKIIERIEGLDEERIKEIEDSCINYRLDFEEKSWKILHKALRKVVTKGTGFAACVYGLKMGGKTGTSQNPHGEDHAWFVCYAQVKKVNLGICILVEHGGGGGRKAAPIAKKILSKIKNISIISKEL